MFINGTLKTKLVFRRKSGRSASIRSTVDIQPVVESRSPIFDNATSLPLSSKARKFRLFSTLTRIRKTSLASVFKKDPVIQISSTLSSSHYVTSSPTEHRECDTEFGLMSSTAADESSNQVDSLVNLDPPGSRIADRVASLRMRTAAVWASIPATMDGPGSCVSSEASTPVKSEMNSLEHDETTSISSATVDSPLSSPATSVTAISDCGARGSSAKLSMIGQKQECTLITPKILPSLDGISLSHPPELIRLARAKPPPDRRSINEQKIDHPVSGCELFPEQLAILRVAGLSDSPSPTPRMTHILSSTAACSSATKHPLSWLPVAQQFTNSHEDLTTSNIRGSLAMFQISSATKMPLRPWSCAKITRAKTKRASRKELLDKEGFLTRISHFLEAGPHTVSKCTRAAYSSTPL